MYVATYKVFHLTLQCSLINLYGNMHASIVEVCYKTMEPCVLHVSSLQVAHSLYASLA